MKKKSDPTGCGDGVHCEIGLQQADSEAWRGRAGCKNRQEGRGGSRRQEPEGLPRNAESRDLCLVNTPVKPRADLHKEPVVRFAFQPGGSVVLTGGERMEQ